MDAVLTVRLDREVKDRATSILKEKGLTPSVAVQHLFDYVLRTGDLPFEDRDRLSPEETEQRLEVFGRFQLVDPLQTTDEAIRAARVGERHGIDAG